MMNHFVAEMGTDQDYIRKLEQKLVKVQTDMVNLEKVKHQLESLITSEKNLAFADEYWQIYGENGSRE